MNENNKKAELGWVMFDWANSSYSLVISTAIFPVKVFAAIIIIVVVVVKSQVVIV